MSNIKMNKGVIKINGATEVPAIIAEVIITPELTPFLNEAKKEGVYNS